MNQLVLNRLETEFGLKPSDYFLLELVPLIEMIWADGDNQVSELRLLYDFAIRHVAALDRVTNGGVTVTAEQVNDFLDRFAHAPPPPGFLNALREFVYGELLVEPHERIHNHQTVLRYCVDIAAAAVRVYPFGLRERVLECEKALLEELFETIGSS